MDLSSVGSFDKSRLKRTATVVKNTLPSKEDIASEMTIIEEDKTVTKQGAMAAISTVGNFDKSRLKRTATVVKNTLPTKEDIASEKAMFAIDEDEDDFGGFGEEEADEEIGGFGEDEPDEQEAVKKEVASGDTYLEEMSSFAGEFKEDDSLFMSRAQTGRAKRSVHKKGKGTFEFKLGEQDLAKDNGAAGSQYDE